MSLTGQKYLELQEEVNTLGYDTVEEAIADGWDSAEYYSCMPRKDEQTKAHEAWLMERSILIDELEMLVQDTPYKVYKDTIKRAIDFIKRGEV